MRDRRELGGIPLVIVGLTGKYCAGKDHVARIFESNGYSVIDVDSLGHEALAERSAQIVEIFGRSLAAEDGTVNRRALGRIVFGNPTAMARLEAILHPAMVQKVKNLIAGMGSDVIVNAAILHHMGLDVLCRAVVFVTAPLPARLLRAMRRDRLPLRDALARITSQKGIGPQFNAPAVDTYTVRNWGSGGSLEHRVARLAQRLRG
jgi:dephospho-CoA kinase